MLQKRELPFNNDGSEYNALLKTNVVLKNGKSVSMMSFVPKELHYDDAIAGVNLGLQLGERSISAQTDIYSLIDGRVDLIGKCAIRYFKNK